MRIGYIGYKVAPGGNRNREPGRWFFFYYYYLRCTACVQRRLVGIYNILCTYDHEKETNQKHGNIIKHIILYR